MSVRAQGASGETRGDEGRGKEVSEVRKQGSKEVRIPKSLARCGTYCAAFRNGKGSPPPAFFGSADSKGVRGKMTLLCERAEAKST